MYFQFSMFFNVFIAPTSSTNPEDEDIDIVGEGDNSAIGNKTSSSESSRDLQLHVYGPPQFTEADVLACMNTLEHETENQDEEMADNSDSGKKSPSSSETLTSSSTSAIKREMDSENENENEVMNNTETKNMEDNKENIADKSKCAKCLVSTL